MDGGKPRMDVGLDDELATPASIGGIGAEVELLRVVRRVDALARPQRRGVDEDLTGLPVHHEAPRARLAVRELPDGVFDDVALHHRALAGRDGGDSGDGGHDEVLPSSVPVPSGRSDGCYPFAPRQRNGDRRQLGSCLDATLSRPYTRSTMLVELFPISLAATAESSPRCFIQDAKFRRRSFGVAGDPGSRAGCRQVAADVEPALHHWAGVALLLGNRRLKRIRDADAPACVRGLRAGELNPALIQVDVALPPKPLEHREPSAHVDREKHPEAPARREAAMSAEASCGVRYRSRGTFRTRNRGRTDRGSAPSKRRSKASISACLKTTSSFRMVSG